jgi:hypothetical protein
MVMNEEMQTMQQLLDELGNLHQTMRNGARRKYYGEIVKKNIEP